MRAVFEHANRGAVLGAVTILCWAGFNVAAKAGVDAGLSPAVLSFLRYVTPGVFAIPLWIWLRGRSSQAELPFIRIVALAILGGPLFGLTAVAGYQFAPLSHGLLFAPVAVFVAGAISSAMLLRTRILPSRVVGAAVMLCGLALLVGVDIRGLGSDWHLGVAFFLLAGGMWGVYTTLLKHWRIPVLEGTAAVASLSAIAACIVIGPWALPDIVRADPEMVAIQIVMQGVVGGVLSVAALMAALQYMSTQTAAMLPTFTPAAALIIAWQVIGTEPKLVEFAGAGIIFAGFALATQAWRRPMVTAEQQGTANAMRPMAATSPASRSENP